MFDICWRCLSLSSLWYIVCTRIKVTGSNVPSVTAGLPNDIISSVGGEQNFEPLVVSLLSTFSCSRRMMSSNFSGPCDM